MKKVWSLESQVLSRKTKDQKLDNDSTLDFRLQTYKDEQIEQC
ncbi:MAG: hypothetical protein QOE33_551 [Acidobacteriota bacterium]|nr:hypothetical protein [Acidobacteriota bacterium]